MEEWDQAFAELREFDKYVTMTAGNAGTLDMLSRERSGLGLSGWICSTPGWQMQNGSQPEVGPPCSRNVRSAYAM